MRLLIVCLLLGCLAGCKSTEPTTLADATCSEAVSDPDSLNTLPVLIGGLRGVLDKVQYPRSERKPENAGRSFRTLVEFVINRQGQPTSLEVAESSGSSRLDLEVKDAVKRSRFKPARRDGEPICMQMTLPVTFHLN